MKLRKFDTAQNLAYEFGVTERTIRSDVQELTCQGYGIQADAGRGGGIRWVGNKRGFPFSDTEIEVLKRLSENASEADKRVVARLITDRTPQAKPPFARNDIYGLLGLEKTQAQLARELGISKSHLTRILTGEKKPSAALAQKISALKNAKNEGSQENDDEME
jgi:biotin operon repressor